MSSTPENQIPDNSEAVPKSKKFISANDSSNNLIPESTLNQLDQERNNKTPAVIVQDDVYSYDIVNNVKDHGNINMININ